jgi:hypothetical protein
LRHQVFVLPSPTASPASQAGFNEHIKHIIRKLQAVFVQPQQLQDKSLDGDVEHQMIFAGPIDHIPDFDRPVGRSRHDLGPVRGKRDRHDEVAVGICLLAQQPQRACQTSQQASVLAKEGRFEGSQRTRIPDFDRLVTRSRHNLGPVRGKRHRLDGAAVGVRLLAQHLQFVCQTSQQASVLAKEGRFEGSGAPESQTLIVLSSDPDTILVPSGENATDVIQLLCAFVFSLSSPSASARQASRRQFWPRRRDLRAPAHPNPRL